MYDDNPDPRDFEQRTSADGKLAIKFYVKPVQDHVKSAEEGRPIFRDVDYVEIRVPGDQCNVVTRPVTTEDQRRFSRQYSMFKDGKEQSNEGTPLEEVPWITRSQVEELKYMRVSTLEQLADLNDSVCSRYAGTIRLKQRAKEHLEAASKAAPAAAFEEFKQQMQNEVDAMKRTIEEQSAIIQNQRKQLEAKSAQS